MKNKEKLVNSILSEVLDSVKAIKKVSAKELPELAKEILLEGKLNSLIGFSIAAVFWVIAYFVFIQSPKEHSGLGYLPLLVSIIPFFMSVSELVSIYWAPKMYILNKLSYLIKD
jgi:uncharacterized membrane protein